MKRFAILGLAVLNACGGEPPDSESWSAPELSYVFADEWRAGVATVETERVFRSFGFMTKVTGDTLFEYQARSVDGSWSGWRPLAFVVGDEVEQRRGHAVLPQPATAMRLRTKGASAPELVRFAFHETEQPLHDDDLAELAVDEGQRTALRARGGHWKIPRWIYNYGKRASFRYTYAKRCSGRLKVGARRLGRWLVRHSKAWTYYGYSCRRIVGGSGLSVHATGRAIDVMVRPARRYRSGKRAYYPYNADNDKGNPIGNWLVRNARRIGVSFIIWDRAKWGAHYPRRNMLQRYGGAHPHNDHLHIELTPHGAKQSKVPFCKLPGLKKILRSRC